MNSVLAFSSMRGLPSRSAFCPLPTACARLSHASRLVSPLTSATAWFHASSLKLSGTPASSTNACPTLMNSSNASENLSFSSRVEMNTPSLPSSPATATFPVPAPSATLRWQIASSANSAVQTGEIIVSSLPLRCPALSPLRPSASASGTK